MTNYTIGAQMYSCRTLTQDEAGLLSTMKALKEMGYTQLQYSGAGKDIPAEAFAEYLKETGTLCGSTHISFQEMEEDLDKVIRNHKLWNCAYPGIGGLPGEYRESKEGFITFAKKADAIAERLAGEAKKMAEDTIGQLTGSSVQLGHSLTLLFLQHGFRVFNGEKALFQLFFRLCQLSQLGS